MSNWFLIAAAAPLLWSITNHIDKFMLAKCLQRRGVGALVIFSALSSILVLPFIAYFKFEEVSAISKDSLLLLFFLGFLSAAGLYLYLTALEDEETSIVIPLFQLIPVFGYLLSYFILGETLTRSQMLSSLLVTFGVILLSLEFREGRRIQLKGRILMLVVSSSVMFALYDVLFKKVAVAESFWGSVFWQYVSLTFAGILLFLAVRKFRGEFLTMLRSMGGKLLSLSVASELLYTLGSWLHSFATLLAPVALVLVVSGCQPLFVFIGGVLLTFFLPNIAKENISAGHLLHKLISIAIITAGNYFLYTSL
jgi:uncharacterized membrane protein